MQIALHNYTDCSYINLMLRKNNLNIKNLYTFLVFLYIGVMLGFGSVPTEPDRSSILVNADAIRRDNAYGQMMVFLQAKELLRLSNKKRYREVRRKYKISRRLYKKYNFLADKTARRIDEVAVQNPELLLHINQLTRENGSVVQAYVGSSCRFSLFEPKGKTVVRYEKGNNSDAPLIVMKEEAIKGILLLSRQYDAIKITLATDGSIVDTRHELGHFEVAVTQSLKYYQYLNSLSTYQRRTSGGHCYGDRSGHLAVHYE